VKDRKRYVVTDKDYQRWKYQEEYLDKYYFQKIKELKKDPLTEFKRLLGEDDLEEFSLHKAKKLAQVYNFSDQVVADAVRPYKHGPKRRRYHQQLRLDSFWGAEEWASDDKTIKASFFKD